jgi:hypothetical protein
MLAVNGCWFVTTTVACGGLTLSTGVKLIVRLAESDFVGSATEMAVTVTVAGEGTLPGAVYRPFASIVPLVLFPPTTPFTCQVTAWLLVFTTVADNWRVCDVSTAALCGLTVTLTIGVTITEAEAEMLVLASATAEIMNVVGVATEGAVYKPVEVIVPVAELPPFT